MVSKKSEKDSTTEIKITLRSDLLESDAFRSLTKIAIIVYLDFRMKYAKKKVRLEKVGKQVDKDFEYSYRRAEKRKNICSKSFSRAIEHLTEKGFIDIVKVGVGGSKPFPSIYRQSNRWKKYGTKEFKSAPKPENTKSKRKPSSRLKK